MSKSFLHLYSEAFCLCTQQRTSDSLLNDLINLELRSDFNVSIFRLNKIKSDEMDEWKKKKKKHEKLPWFCN